MEYPKFEVCCGCFTFNQSKYITDTMNGFTMQQTDFPFVCTIVDDASTDGEQEVIRKYVEYNFDFSEDSVAYNKGAIILSHMFNIRQTSSTILPYHIKQIIHF